MNYCVMCKKKLPPNYKKTRCKKCYGKFYTANVIIKELQEKISFNDKISVRIILNLKVKAIEKINTKDHKITMAKEWIAMLKENDLLEEFNKTIFVWVNLDIIRNFMEKYSEDKGESFNINEEKKLLNRCKICNKLLEFNKKRDNNYCRKCNDKRKLAEKINILLKNISYNEKFNLNDLINKTHEKESIVKNTIYSLVENDLVTRHSKYNYSLKSKTVINKFLNKYGNQNFDVEKDNNLIKTNYLAFKTHDKMETDLKLENSISKDINKDSYKEQVISQDSKITNLINEGKNNNPKKINKLSNKTDIQNTKTCLICGTKITENISGISKKYCANCNQNIINLGNLIFISKYISFNEKFSIKSLVNISNEKEWKIEKIIKDLKKFNLIKRNDFINYNLQSEDIIKNFLKHNKKLIKELSIENRYNINLNQNIDFDTLFNHNNLNENKFNNNSLNSQLYKHYFISKHVNYDILMEGKITINEYDNLLNLLNKLKKITKKVSIYVIDSYIDVLIELEITFIDLEFYLKIITKYGWEKISLF